MPVYSKSDDNKQQSLQIDRLLNVNEDLNTYFIYEISNKHDKRINYIGRTIDIKRRSQSHKYHSKYSDTKLYRMINEYGGWEEFQIDVIDVVYSTSTQVRMIEQFYMDERKALMNAKRAYNSSRKNNDLNGVISIFARRTQE